MTGKNFWNWIGLPCMADIASIQETCHRQEEQLAVVTESNSELLRQVSALSDLLTEQTTGLEKQLNSLDVKLDSIIKGLTQTQALSAKDCANLSEQLSKLRTTVSSMGAEEKARLSQLVSDAKNQNELLRLLITNSLMDDLAEFR